MSRVRPVKVATPLLKLTLVVPPRVVPPKFPTGDPLVPNAAADHGRGPRAATHFLALVVVLGLG